MRRLQTHTTAALLFSIAGLSYAVGQTSVFPLEPCTRVADLVNPDGGPRYPNSLVSAVAPHTFDDRAKDGSCVKNCPFLGITEQHYKTSWVQGTVAASMFLNNFRLLPLQDGSINGEGSAYIHGSVATTASTFAASWDSLTGENSNPLIDPIVRVNDSATDCLQDVDAEAARREVFIQTKSWSMDLACSGYAGTEVIGNAWVQAYPTTLPTPEPPFQQANIITYDPDSDFNYRPNIGGEAHIRSSSQSWWGINIIKFWKSLSKEHPCVLVECALDGRAPKGSASTDSAAKLEGSGSIKLVPEEDASIDFIFWVDGRNLNSRYLPVFQQSVDQWLYPDYFYGFCTNFSEPQPDYGSGTTVTTIEVRRRIGTSATRVIETLTSVVSRSRPTVAWRTGISGPRSMIPTDTPVLVQIPFNPSATRPISIEINSTTRYTPDPTGLCVLSPAQVDLDGDGVITYNDRYQVSSRLGQVSGSGGYLPAADVLLDGVINLTDYQLYHSCWLQTVPCFADIAGAGQGTVPDGELTADDLIVFLNNFFNDNLRVDVAGPGQSQSPDGQLTSDDIIVFINYYFTGC